MAYKIVMFASDQRTKTLVASLDKQGIDYEVGPGKTIIRGDTTKGMPDFKEKLKYHETYGRTIAVIDEASYGNRKAIFEGIRGFASDTTRVAGANLRIIYIFPSGFSAADLRRDINKLIELGVFDFVIPTEAKDEGIEPSRVLADRITTPQRKRDMAAYVMAAKEAAPAAVSAQSQAKPSQPVVLNVDTRSRITVSVASTMQRGGSTTLAMALANLLTYVDKNVALITDKETARALWSLKTGNAEARNANMQSNFMHGRVRIYAETAPTDVANGTRFVVLDMGRLAKDGEAKDRQDGAIEMSTARLMAMPFNTPKDLLAARAWLNKSWEELNRWALCVWGADEAGMEALAKNVKAVSPSSLPFRLPFLQGVFISSKPDAQLAGLARDLRIISPAECEKICSQVVSDKPSETTAPAAVQDAGDVPADVQQKKGLFHRKDRKDA